MTSRWAQASIVRITSQHKAFSWKIFGILDGRDQQLTKYSAAIAAAAAHLPQSPRREPRLKKNRFFDVFDVPEISTFLMKFS